MLGLAPGAAPHDVRRAFRLAAQLLHPDRVADLSDDIRAEAHRRMVELAEAYRICSALAMGEPPPPPRHDTEPHRSGPLRTVGGQAAALLASVAGRLDVEAEWAAYREVVQTLEQVAGAWPGTAEGDAARVALVTSRAAAGALSPRERAGHLVLVLDEAARLAAWESLYGRDELAVAQVVYAHPTADDDLRRRARTRLVELGDWTTLAHDPDADVRRHAQAHLLLHEGRALAERAAWLTKRERAAFDADLASWRDRVSAIEDALPESLRDDLSRAIREVVAC